jgi:hypothetical protein
VIAAPSQAAALRAWGTHQDLFTSGQACVSTDDAAREAALEHPETLLRRPIGSDSAYEAEPAGLPKVPDAPRPKEAKAKTAKRGPPKPPADRTPLDAAESELRDLDQGRKQEEADLRREEEAFQARREAEQDAYVRARKAATAVVVAARKVYRKAGGSD